MRVGKRLTSALGVFALAVALAPQGGAAASPATDSGIAGPRATDGRLLGVGAPDTVPGRYIVVLDGQRSLSTASAQAVRSQAADLVATSGGSVRSVYSAALRGFSMSGTEAQARRMAARPGVKYVQVVTTLRADDVEMAPGTQDSPPSWGIDRIDGKLDNSYSYPNTGAGVTAYIMDTSVDITHPNFEGRASIGYPVGALAPAAGDPCNRHGTHVAGTVGSKDYGVAKQVNIVSVQILNCFGVTQSDPFIDALEWVAKNAKRPAVANMSVGGGISQAVDDAVQGIIDAGVAVSVSAGNEGGKDACGRSPSRLPAANTTGATDKGKDNRAAYSNIGRCVDIFAPGTLIKSTDSGGGSVDMAGTSMATPHVTGAAALYLSAHPDASPAQVSEALATNAEQGVVLYPGEGSPNRLLNVTKLGGPAGPASPRAAFTATCAPSTNDCGFDAAASTDPDGTVSSYAWDFGDGSTASGVQAQHSFAKAGTYTVSLTVTDNSGRTGTTSQSVTVGSTTPSGKPPVAALTAACSYGTGCAFDGSKSTDPDGDIASYDWAFGDNTTATGAKVTHAYPNARKDYVAQLTVTDRTGATSTATRKISCLALNTKPYCYLG